MRRSVVAALAVAAFSTATAEAQTRVEVLVFVTDSETGSAVEHVEVAFGRSLFVSDDVGSFRYEAPPGRHRLVLTAMGFLPKDTTVLVGRADTIRVSMRPRPLDLDPLAVQARRSEGGGAREKALFHREPVPGLVGVSQLELRERPILGEVDVLRSLQALPGVIAANDMSARLHVRGGAPDQNVYLLDGARVFAPYHMFGIFGGFNADAVGRSEIYRGSFPARHGGALSSIVELEQRPGSGDGLEGVGGVGMLGARMLLTAPLPAGEGSWLVAARRTHADIVLDRYNERGFPYAFWDLHGHVTARPDPQHRVRLSFFGSQDRFRTFLESVSDRMDSRWSNGVTSVSWDWTLGPRSGLSTLLWGSRYQSALEIGGGVERPSSNNSVAIGGLTVSFSRRGDADGWRAGLDLEGGNVGLTGGEGSGGLFEGTESTDHSSVAGFLEYERRLGKLRLGPGFRIESFPTSGAVLLAPRLFARLHLTEDVAFTAGLTRTHQALSTLRDDRFPLPGPPFWFAHGAERPVARSDAATIAFEGWIGEALSFELTTYARSFGDIARWRPSGERSLDGLHFDDGEAVGFAASARRHRGRLTGWIGYEFSRVRLREVESGRQYIPPWEHAQTVETAVSLRVWREATISGQVTFSTGAPFWPQSGSVSMWRLDPLRGVMTSGGTHPTWAEDQLRLPEYLRADISARWPFQIGSISLVPHVSLLNITGRQNVMFYILRKDPYSGVSRALLLPELQLPIPIAFPSIGLDIQF